MNEINDTEVIIDGHVYTISGAEKPEYVQKIASYINSKYLECKKQQGFGRMDSSFQSVMVAVNMADDYFRALQSLDTVNKDQGESEKEIYRLKHELVTTQMKLEEMQKVLSEREQALSGKEQELSDMAKELTRCREELQREKKAAANNRGRR